MSSEQREQSPTRERTLVDTLVRIGRITDTGPVFLDGDLAERRLSFAELVAAARTRGRCLRALGLRHGDRLAILVPESEDFVVTFLGAMIEGIVPVPLHPPIGLADLTEYRERLAHILEIADARVLLCTPIFADVLEPIVQTHDRSVMYSIDELVRLHPAPPRPHRVAPADTCFLQFTSGSTGLPKGVVVTHGNLIANARAIMQDGLHAQPGADIGVSWLPLYHDMGLIGFVLAPLVTETPVVYIPPLSFVRKPTIWMQTVNRHRGTITFGPNFGFALAARRATRSDVEQLDLSCLRVAGCGAEPVSPITMRKFARVFEPARLDPNAIMPCYGMAEATLAVSFGSLTQPLAVDVVDADRYERERRVVDAPSGEGLHIVCCGRAFPHHEIAILDRDGRRLEECRVGEIAVHGPSVTPRYEGNREASAETFRNGWLHTGDLGYLRGGELYVSGRRKDLVIIHGRNHDPHQIEWLAETARGITPGTAVAFAVRGPETERLVVVAESRLEGAERDVKRCISEALGIVPDEVLLTPRRGLPRTSSGKVRRAKTRELYLAGRLETLASRSSPTTVDLAH